MPLEIWRILLLSLHTGLGSIHSLSSPMGPLWPQSFSPSTSPGKTSPKHLSSADQDNFPANLETNASCKFHFLQLLRDFWHKVDPFTSSCQEFSPITALADRVLPMSAQASVIVILPVQVMEPGNARTCCSGQHRAVSVCQPRTIQVTLLFFSMPSLLQRNFRAFW